MSAHGPLSIQAPVIDKKHSKFTFQTTIVCTNYTRKNKFHQKIQSMKMLINNRIEIICQRRFIKIIIK